MEEEKDEEKDEEERWLNVFSACLRVVWADRLQLLLNDGNQCPRKKE